VLVLSETKIPKLSQFFCARALTRYAAIPQRKEN